MTDIQISDWKITDGKITDRKITDSNIQTDGVLPEPRVHSGIFDWLICPPQSVSNLLDNDIPDFNRKSIRIHKGRPYWEDYNLFFWHNFMVTDNQNRHIDIDKTIAKEMDRWSYLRTRFSELDPLKTVFVISNTQNNLATEVYNASESEQYQLTSILIAKLEHSLARYFSTSVDSIHLEVITRNNRSSGLEDRNRTTFLPLDHNEWKGSKKSWNLWWQNLCLALNEQPSKLQ